MLSFCCCNYIFDIRVFVNTLRPGQHGRHVADDIFKCIFMNENVWILIKISQTFVPKGPINYIPALVQIMAWRRPGDKPLSEPMMVRLPTHICVTRPQCIDTVHFQLYAPAFYFVVASYRPILLWPGTDPFCCALLWLGTDPFCCALLWSVTDPFCCALLWPGTEPLCCGQLQTHFVVTRYRPILLCFVVTRYRPILLWPGTDPFCCGQVQTHFVVTRYRPILLCFVVTS